MKLRSVDVSGWRQFEDVHLDFHPRLTILTGQNGAGKTTLLNLIAPHFGWSLPMASPPTLSSHVASLLTDVWRRWTGQKDAAAREHNILQIGKITYHDGSSAEVQVPEESRGITYRVTYDDAQVLPGLYVPSHRPLFLPTESTVMPSPISAWSRPTAFSTYVSSFQPQWTGKMPSPIAPLFALKSILFGLPEGDPSDESAFTAAAFESKLRKVLPPSIGFERLHIAYPHIALETTTGTFALDAVSGGVAAAMDITFQIFAFPGDDREFVVLIDEPENHLHPEMQRLILPQLTEAFQDVQFIVATHAPMIVTSMRDSTVYALLYEEEAAPEGPRRVHALRIEDFERAGTANDTLRKVLGLEFTMPNWAADEIKASLSVLSDEGISPGSLDKMEARLTRAGLGRYVTDALMLASERANEGPEAIQ